MLNMLADRLNNCSFAVSRQHHITSKTKQYQANTDEEIEAEMHSGFMTSKGKQTESD